MSIIASRLDLSGHHAMSAPEGNAGQKWSTRKMCSFQTRSALSLGTALTYPRFAGPFFGAKEALAEMDLIKPVMHFFSGTK
jgi:hypothetical protein